MSKVRIDLSDINKLINALDGLSKDINKLSDELPKIMAESGKKYLDRQYLKSPNKMNPNINLNSIKTRIEKIENGYKIVTEGDDVLYEEFGTGDEGKKHQNPMKSKYKLDPYNNGGTITNVADIKDNRILSVLQRNGVVSGNFWFYNKNGIGNGVTHELTSEQKLNRAKYLINHSDEVNITQGVPAGKEMWNTINYLKSNKGIQSIFRKRGKEINDKFINAIKK